MRLLVTIVLILGVLSMWQYRRVRQTGAMVRNVDLVLAQTADLSALEQSYELQTKDFYLTGDSSYQVAALDSFGQLRAAVAALQALTKDDSGAKALADSVANAIAADGGNGISANDGKGISGNGGRGMSGNGGKGISGKGGKEASTAARATGRGGAQMRQGGSVRMSQGTVQVLVQQIIARQRQVHAKLVASNLVRASELQAILWALILAIVVLGIVLFRNLRVRHEAGLRESEERYKMLFEKSPLAKWIYDVETLHFLEVNEAAVKMYGYSEREFRDLTLADIRPPEDVAALMADISNVRRDPRTYHSAHWRHMKKSGEVIDVEVTAHSIDLGGRRVRLVAVVDTTERRRQERQLQQLNADLARRAADLSASNAELERFAYIASHDLQEPLRMVTSFLQLLEKRYKGQLDEKADQYIHFAVDGAERMKALIMDLLEYSQVGTGTESFEWVDFYEVMAGVADVFRDGIIAARALLDIGDLPRVWGDKVQLTQLMQNLIGNALKYGNDRPPVIRVSGEERLAYWQFAVADNGIGIDPQFFDRIFIIFQRLHNKSDYSGTGIGLAICKKIVERHGGKIWVESQQMQGSTFYFTIGKPK